VWLDLNLQEDANRRTEGHNLILLRHKIILIIHHI